jgi:hypothetical protein
MLWVLSFTWFALPNRREYTYPPDSHNDPLWTTNRCHGYKNVDDGVAMDIVYHSDDSSYNCSSGRLVCVG